MFFYNRLIKIIYSKLKIRIMNQKLRGLCKFKYLKSESRVSLHLQVHILVFIYTFFCKSHVNVYRSETD